jgi:hypothetical protein
MLLLDRIAALAQVARPKKSYANPRAHGNTNRPLALSVIGAPVPRRLCRQANRDGPKFRLRLEACDAALR